MTVRHALGWSFAERHAGLVIGLVGSMALARLIQPADVGLYSVSASIVAVLAVVRDFGVSEYIIQAPTLDDARMRSARAVAFAVAWPLAALLIAGRGNIAAFYGDARIAEILAILSIHFVLLPLTSPSFAVLNRELAFRRIFGLQMACTAVQVLVSVVLAWQGHGPSALAWGPVAGVALQTMILLAWRGRECLRLPTLAHVREVLSFGGRYVASRTLETLARNVTDPILAKQYDFTSVGLFSRASGLVDMFHSNISEAVIRVSTPAFAAVHRDQRPLADAFIRATAVFACLSWTFFGFVAICAAEIIVLMFGPAWVAAAPLATIMALAALPSGLYEMVPQALSATGHVSRRLRVAAITAPLQIALVWFASWWSLEAVAGAAAVSGLVNLLLLGHTMRTAFGVGLRPMLRACGASALVALAAVGAMLAAAATVRSIGLPAIATLTAAPVAGAMAWWWSARLLRHPAHTEVARLLSRRRAHAHATHDSP